MHQETTVCLSRPAEELLSTAPISKLFGRVVDAIKWDWFVQLQQEGLMDHNTESMPKLMQSFITIFLCQQRILYKGRSYPQCRHCGMQANLWFTAHWKTESCAIGTERKAQRKAVIDSVIALCFTFKVHGEVLENVKVFKYLGHLLAQDNDNSQAIGLQI